MMTYLFGDILFSIVGRLYLFLYYRNLKKMRSVLAEKYNNSYIEAGNDLLFQFLRLFAFVCFLGMLVFIGVVIYGAIVH